MSPFGAIDDLNVMLKFFGRIAENKAFPDQNSLPPFLTSGGGRSRMSILLRTKVTSSRVNLLSLCVRRNDPVMWSWISEEHTSELQSRFDLVCRLLLEKK